MTPALDREMMRLMSSFQCFDIVHNSLLDRNLSTSQDIGWKEHLENYPFCIECNVKR